MSGMAGERVLYVDVLADHPVQNRKLAGVRRYAALRGWDVLCVTRREMDRTKVGDLLEKHRPVGVVVEGSGRRNAFPPHLFGRMPVSYVEYPAAETAGRAPNVSIDDDAIADVAFRELSLGRPSAFAVVGYRYPHLWSRLRVGAFRKRCERAGVSCIAFPESGAGLPKRFEALLEDWIASLPPKTAVFAAGDSSGAAVSRAARAAGRHIPKDLTLCSTCDIPEVCEDAPTPVTSVHLDFERMGWLAAESLASGENASVGPLFVARRLSTAGRGRREPWILQAVGTIRAEACSGLSIGDLVVRLRSDKGRAVSRRNFDRRFREAMGHSANEEILSVRLESACALLAQTDTPVTMVHDFCGVGCYSALDALFRSRFGMSMGKWRERNAR